MAEKPSASELIQKLLDAGLKPGDLKFSFSPTAEDEEVIEIPDREALGLVIAKLDELQESVDRITAKLDSIESA